MDGRFLSEKRWADADIAPLLPAPVARAIREAFKFDRLSKVQAETLPLLAGGGDVFAKAKTGGGKTLAFLIPAIARLVATRAVGRSNAIGIVIVSPTRELALQILAEAQTLVSFFTPALRVQAVIGGTNIRSEQNRLAAGSNVCAADILVATPGRCVDHLETTPGFRAALRNASTLILDEADRLLDMGFAPALDKIRDALPPVGARQTLLFSATVPEAVKSVALRFLRPGFPLVDTVGADDTATNPQVTQEALVLHDASVVPALARVISHIVASNPA
jgi:ATP-dependent RNA helicase MSS116, mitochondrial